MGRHKTPRHIHEQHDSWRAKTREEVDVPDRGEPIERPHWFPDDNSVASREWDRITAILEEDGRSTNRDAVPIALYCQAVQDYQKTLRVKNPTSKTLAGETKVDPRFQARCKAAELILKLGARLGLTEIDRANGALPVGESKEAKNITERFIREAATS